MGTVSLLSRFSAPDPLVPGSRTQPSSRWCWASRCEEQTRPIDLAKKRDKETPSPSSPWCWASRWEENTRPIDLAKKRDKRDTVPIKSLCSHWTVVRKRDKRD